MEPLKIKEVNTGFCRILYKTKNKEGESIFYCIQDNGFGNLEVYRTTQGPDFEPNYPVDFKDFTLFEIPSGDSKLEIKVREFLEARRASK